MFLERAVGQRFSKHQAREGGSEQTVESKYCIAPYSYLPPALRPNARQPQLKVVVLLAQVVKEVA